MAAGAVDHGSGGCRPSEGWLRDLTIYPPMVGLHVLDCEFRARVGLHVLCMQRVHGGVEPWVFLPYPRVS